MLDRLFAGVYDWVMAGPERLGLRDWRSRLLDDLTGEVLEIGAGTGLNLEHYPTDVQLTLLEPVPEMRVHLCKRAGEIPVVDGAAEALPFEDGRFDAVVSGLVLCSVHDLNVSLAEVRRVLKPGGKLVFIEHVASEHRWTAALQRFLNPMWKVIGRGCHLTRETEAAIQRAGFQFQRLDRSDLPGGALVVKAAIHGVAIKI